MEASQLISRAHLDHWGVRSRVRRRGPEKELIDWFLATLPIKIPARRRLSIFEEPKLESGFPDLVLVVWDERRTEGWLRSRDALHGLDFKVLQLLYKNPKLNQYQLERLLASAVDSSIKRLIEAGMIYKSKSKITLFPIRRIFAIDQIIAIEAKVNDTPSCIDQAVLNTWFANESVILLPKQIRSASSRELALQWNIRVVTPDPCDRIEPQRKPIAPISYASWQFNEWVWRAYRDSES